MVIASIVIILGLATAFNLLWSLSALILAGYIAGSLALGIKPSLFVSMLKRDQNLDVSKVEIDILNKTLNVPIVKKIILISDLMYLTVFSAVLIVLFFFAGLAGAQWHLMVLLLFGLGGLAIVSLFAPQLFEASLKNKTKTPPSPSTSTSAASTASVVPTSNTDVSGSVMTDVSGAAHSAPTGATSTTSSTPASTTDSTKLLTDAASSINTSITSGLSSVQLPITSPIDLQGNQVFHVQGQFDYSMAKSVCKAYGAKLANYDQIKNSYDNGAEWCDYGWSEDAMVLYPTQYKSWSQYNQSDQPQRCGIPGINGGYNTDMTQQLGVNCFGKKPSGEVPANAMPPAKKRAIPQYTISPFNYTTWSGV